MELFSDFLSWDISGEIISSLIIMGIEAILFIIMGIMAHFHDPLKPSKGLLWVGEELVTFFDKKTVELMGPRFAGGFGGVLLALCAYLFIAFIWGMTGLPAPVTDLAVTLSLGLSTFLLIHGVSIYFTHWKYFKRYIEPFPVFLPINLLSMWSILLSITLRLFGNALAGFVLMELIYDALESLSAMIFSSLPDWISGSFIAPFITPILHAYFDLFSGFIQTTIFLFLTAINVSMEAPEIDPQEEKFMREGGR